MSALCYTLLAGFVLPAHESTQRRVSGTGVPDFHQDDKREL